MAETVKKISRKIRGIPEANFLVGDEAEQVYYWTSFENITVTIRRYGKPFEKIICPECGKTLNEKLMKNLVDHHSFRLAANIEFTGAYHKKLSELYVKIKNKKLNLEEAFRIRKDIRREFYDKPKGERAGSGSATKSIPTVCPECGEKLGLLDVSIEAKPMTETAPSSAQWVALEKTPRQMRILKKHLIPKGEEYTEWIEGSDLEPFIQKMQKWETELEKLPYIRELQRPLSNLDADIGTAINAIRENIRTRIDSVYNILATPPNITITHASASEPTKEKTAFEKEMEELGAKKIARR